MASREQLQAQVKMLTKLRDDALSPKSRQRYEKRLNKAQQSLKSSDVPTIKSPQRLIKQRPASYVAKEKRKTIKEKLLAKKEADRKKAATKTTAEKAIKAKEKKAREARVLAEKRREAEEFKAQLKLRELTAEKKAKFKKDTQGMLKGDSKKGREARASVYKKVSKDDKAAMEVRAKKAREARVLAEKRREAEKFKAQLKLRELTAKKKAETAKKAAADKAETAKKAAADAREAERIRNKKRQDDEKGRQERQQEAAYARSITADRKKAAEGVKKDKPKKVLLDPVGGMGKETSTKKRKSTFEIAEAKRRKNKADEKETSDATIMAKAAKVSNAAAAAKRKNKKERLKPRLPLKTDAAAIATAKALESHRIEGEDIDEDLPDNISSYLVKSDKKKKKETAKKKAPKKHKTLSEYIMGSGPDKDRVTIFGLGPFDIDSGPDQYNYRKGGRIGSTSRTVKRRMGGVIKKGFGKATHGY